MVLAMMIVIFFCVGFLEIISIAFRPISLSFRLYGNVFAGENLLESMSQIVQHPDSPEALVFHPRRSVIPGITLIVQIADFPEAA